MFFRKVTTKRGDKEYAYLKLIENYRDGGKVKQRVIANLGNIDRLSPDKVETLISGLSKFFPAGTLPLFNTADSPDTIVNACTEPLHAVWTDLRLPPLLAEAGHGFEAPERFAALIEAAVISHIISPRDTRPLSTRCAELDMPLLGKAEIPGIVFFQAFCRLADLAPSLEKHLLEHLQKRWGRPFALYLRPLAGEFVGNECGITTAGTSYHIRSYRKPLPLAILIHPSGFPVGCRLLSEGLTPTSLTSIQNQWRETYDLDVHLLIEESLLGTTPMLKNAVVSLSPERFSRAPFTDADPWAGNGVISGQYWVKTVEHEGARYILSHDLAPENLSDQELDDSLARATRQLDKLRATVRQKKLCREKTIRQRAQKIIEEYGCCNFIGYSYDPSKPDFRYNICEEVIKKEKMLRRTRVLHTDIRSITGDKIASSYNACAGLAAEYTVIQDMTRLPVVYPYADQQHSEAFIRGLLQVYTLAGLVRRLASAENA